MIKFRGQQIRVLSLDVTGTILRFRAPIGDLYNEAITKAGQPAPPPAVMQKAFVSAYKVTDSEHPCFGSTTMSSREWWSLCVRRALANAIPSLGVTSAPSVALAECLYDEFASAGPYNVLPGAGDLMRWATQKGLIVGITSNADERYPDDVLPALGLPPIAFAVLSKTAPAPKPDPRIFAATLAAANRAVAVGSPASLSGPSRDDASSEMGASNAAQCSQLLMPHDVLHVGDSVKADYRGITAFGGTGVVLHHGNEAVQKQHGDAGVPQDSSLESLEALFAILQAENPEI